MSGQSRDEQVLVAFDAMEAANKVRADAAAHMEAARTALCAAEEAHAEAERRYRHAARVMHSLADGTT